MTLPLTVENALFYPTPSGLRATWNFFGDGSSESDRCAYIAEANRHPGLNTLVFNLLNEDQMSPFQRAYCGALDTARCDLIMRWLKMVAGAGGKIIPAFFDGASPSGSPKGKYYPILNQWNLHEAFISAACAALNPFSVAYLVGCEVNRYFSTAQIEQLIVWIKKYAEGRYVGIHSSMPSNFQYPGNSDFLASESSWSPLVGNKHSVADCIADVKAKQARLPPGHSLWPMEFNSDSEGALCKAQARAMAAMPGVVGIGEPI